jgi:hypothetical protein
MVATVKKWWRQLIETFGSVTFLLAAILYQGKPDNNHKLFNIVSTERYIHHIQVLLKCCYTCTYEVFFLTDPRCRDRRGRDRMVVGFTITCALSAYRHSSCEFQPRSWRSLSMTCARSVVFAGYSGFLHHTNKPDRHDIAELVLKVALNTINNKPIAHCQFRGVGQGMKQIYLYMCYPLFQAQWDRYDQRNHQT